MNSPDLIGIVLVAGLVVFLVGAMGWRLEYDGPLREALALIHADRRRRAWIHVWMIPAMLLTAAGVVALSRVLGDGLAITLALMGGMVYALGAVCFVVSLAFRLTVTPWGAERTVADGDPPDVYVALHHWEDSLLAVHMMSAYAAFAIIGAAALSGGELAAWVGWLGVGWGATFLGGLIVTGPAGGPFSPPIWAHAYTATLGVVLLVS